MLHTSSFSLLFSPNLWFCDFPAAVSLAEQAAVQSKPNARAEPKMFVLEDEAGSRASRRKLEKETNKPWQ